MTDAQILTEVKANLDLSVTTRDAELLNKIELAKSAISTEGISLIQSEDGYSIEDGELIAAYAAFLHRNRNKDAAMPRHLRYMLNNRLFSEKARGDENGQ